MTEQQLNDVWTYSQTEPMESATISDSEGYTVGHIIGAGLDPKKSAEKLAWRIIADHNLNLMAAHAVQGEPLRYTNDGALAECPCCGSIDVGGAHDTVSCYSCDLTVTKPRPLQNAIDAWNTRTGRTHPAPAVQGDPVAAGGEHG